MYHIAGSEKNDTKAQNKTNYLIGDTQLIEKISETILRNIQNKILWVGNLVNCISQIATKNIWKHCCLYVLFFL